MAPTPDYFSIICSEICTKQNGIQLKVGDDSILKSIFLRRGGEIGLLVNGVLPQFDLLKDVILSAYNARKIASKSGEERPRRWIASIRINMEDLRSQIDWGRRTALSVAERSLGRKLLAALLKVKR